MALCKAYADGNPESYPVKTAKKPRKSEEMTVFILSCGEAYALEKRSGKGLLADLWQFPNVDGKLDLPAVMDYLAHRGVAVRDVYRQVEKKHIFTHIEWKMGINALILYGCARMRSTKRRRCLRRSASFGRI